MDHRDQVAILVDDVLHDLLSIHSPLTRSQRLSSEAMGTPEPVDMLAMPELAMISLIPFASSASQCACHSAARKHASSIASIISAGTGVGGRNSSSLLTPQP